MLRVLLVKPPFARLMQNSVYLTYPLGAMLVAAMLKERGHEVLIYHDDVSNPLPIPADRVKLGVTDRKPLDADSIDPYIECLHDFAPDVVGISFNTVDAPAAYEFARIANEFGMRTVAGGVHPSLLPDEAGEHFDAVVVGEGDNPMAAAAFEDPDTTQVDVEGCRDLDAVIADRSCVIGGERYSPFLTGMIQTQRGCPYACSYCAAPTVFGTKVRTRNPGRVGEEVESLATNKGRLIDDSFGVLKGHAIKVCAELAKTGFQWVCDAALQNVDRKFAEALVGGGCKCVNIGLESGSERWRNLSGKPIAPGQAEEVLSDCQVVGLETVVYFMVGFPGETIDELRDTLAWAKALKEMGARPHISIATPYPKTVLWDMVQDRGEVFEGWELYHHQSGKMGFADCTEDEWEEVLRYANGING